MRAITTFIKSYPLMVISIAVALIAVAMIVLLLPKQAAFREEIAKRAAEQDQIRALKQSAMEVPPPDPDGDPIVVTGVVNKPAIDARTRIDNDMGKAYTDIFEIAVQHNRRAHEPMLSNLFPNPGRDIGRLYDAKEAYRNALTAMLNGESVDPATPPALTAAPKVSDDRIAELMASVEQKYLADAFAVDIEQRDRKNLTEQQVDELNAMLIKAAASEHVRHARSIDLYAETDLYNAAFPFDVASWCLPDYGAQPTMAQLWEGQLGLWIQQDILRAMALTNEITEPGTNVTRAPIKRLVKIQIVPGYVGLGGATGGMAAASGTTPNRPAPRPARPVPGEGPIDYLQQYEQLRGIKTEQVDTFSADKRIPDDFTISHTGRRTNELYDVRHVNVDLHMTAKDVNRLMAHLTKVNFMTVLNVTITDVDEYELYNEGYIYGPEDVVQVQLLIESIWLRNWTRELMPKDVRLELGLEKAIEEEEAAPPTP